MNTKFNILLLGAALLTFTTGCDDPDSEYDPGIEFSRTGNVAFVASIENCMSRASMDNTGEARWKFDDAIGAVCTDGSVEVLTLDGTGETRKAIFTGTIPAGKAIGSYAVHPANVTFSSNTLTANLPAEIDANPVSSCSVMMAEIGEDFNIGFTQLMSYISIQFSNVSDMATKIVLTSENSLSGQFSVALPEGMTTGLAARKGNEPLTIKLSDKKEVSVIASFAIPVGQYESLVAKAYNAKGVELCQVECLTSSFNALRANIRAIKVEMPDVKLKKEPIPGTVLVAGIYWAPGNLMYSEGNTESGFQNNWRIAPHQWYYVNSENAAAQNKAVTFKPTSYAPDYDHFNWGGIADPFDCAPEVSATAAVGTDIAGKLYTSQNCTSETKDFSNASFGDLAFWASKGKFRLPTQAEFQKLVNEANIQYAAYKVGDGKYVTGLYFTDPADGATPTVSDEPVELTDDDFTKGLFLPKAGRRYNGTQFNINVQGTQGVYWTSGSITGSGATEPCYGAVFSIQNAVHKYPYWNKAFDAKAGFSIRPVYIEE